MGLVRKVSRFIGLNCKGKRKVWSIIINIRFFSVHMLKALSQRQATRCGRSTIHVCSASPPLFGTSFPNYSGTRSDRYKMAKLARVDCCRNKFSGEPVPITGRLVSIERRPGFLQWGQAPVEKQKVTAGISWECVQNMV